VSKDRVKEAADEKKKLEALQADPAILNFERMFQAHVDANPKIWDHDRGSTMGASEAFACLRATWFKKHAEKPEHVDDAGKALYVKDEEKGSWGAMERGNLIEDHWVVPVVRAQLPKGGKVDFTGDEQTTFVYGQNSSTPDGLYSGLARNALALYGVEDNETGDVVLEVKSVDPRTKLDEEKQIHFGQAQVQMGIFHAMTEYRPLYAVILYVDASFLDDIKVFVVKYNPAVFKAARNRAKRVFTVTDPALIPAEGKLQDACEYCEWKGACAKVSGESIPKKDNGNTLDSDELDRLQELAVEERTYAADEKDAKQRKGEVREEIKQILRDADTKKAKGDNFSISWVWQAGRRTIDTKAAEADGVDLSKYEKIGDGFEKMTISVKGED
jgi:hypothetical protein